MICVGSEKGRTTSRDASIVALVTLPGMLSYLPTPLLRTVRYSLPRIVVPGDMGPRGPLTKVGHPSHPRLVFLPFFVFFCSPFIVCVKKQRRRWSQRLPESRVPQPPNLKPAARDRRVFGDLRGRGGAGVCVGARKPSAAVDDSRDQNRSDWSALPLDVRATGCSAPIIAARS